jgi:2'-5' RNA ligase
MLYFDFPIINQIHGVINGEDIFQDPDDPSFGLETEPHTTLLYGLHDGVTKQNIKNVLDKFTFDAFKISNASLFESENFDVLKFDVVGDGLYEANAELIKYPNTQTYPDYHPHLTIAYLNSGKGKQYVKELNGLEFELTPKYAVYSMPSGDKIKISINIK